MEQEVYPTLQDDRVIRVERAGENNLQDIDVNNADSMGEVNHVVVRGLLYINLVR